MLFDILKKKKANMIEEIKQAFSDVSKNDTNSLVFTLEAICDEDSDTSKYMYGGADFVHFGFIVSCAFRPYKFFLNLSFEFACLDEHDQGIDVQIEKICANLIPITRSKDVDSDEFEFLECLGVDWDITKKECLVLPKECAEKIAELLASDFKYNFTMCEYYLHDEMVLNDLGTFFEKVEDHYRSFGAMFVQEV